MQTHAMPEVKRSRETVRCADGWCLAVEWVEPAAPVAVAVLGHAMMVDRRTLDPRRSGLGSHLASRGIAVVMADLRGHGESGPHAARGGRWSYDDLVNGDAPALMALARRRFPGLGCVAVGHSLFGHVALAHAARHPDDAPEALVLLAANVWAPRWEPDARRRVLKRVLYGVSGALARRCGYLPARRLRVGPADESLAYWEQMVDWYRRDTWDARDGFSYAAAARRIERPVLGIVGAGDRLLCWAEAGRRFLGEVPGATVEVAGRSSGLAFDPDHMALVTDPRARPVWERVAGFIHEVVGAGPAVLKQDR